MRCAASRGFRDRRTTLTPSCLLALQPNPEREFNRVLCSISSSCWGQFSLSVTAASLGPAWTQSSHNSPETEAVRGVCSVPLCVMDKSVLIQWHPLISRKTAVPVHSCLFPSSPSTLHTDAIMSLDREDMATANETVASVPCVQLLTVLFVSSFDLCHLSVGKEFSKLFQPFLDHLLPLSICGDLASLWCLWEN